MSLEAVFLYGLHTSVQLWALAHFVPFWSHPTHATKGYRQWCGCPQFVPLAPLVSPGGGLGAVWRNMRFSLRCLPSMAKQENFDKILHFFAK